MEQMSLLEKLKYNVEKKVDLVETAPARYFMRAMLAAVFLTLATTTSFLVAEHIEHFLLIILPETADVATASYNLTKIMYAISFGWALVMILFMNTELFTSNAMYFSSQLFLKNVSWKKALKVLTLCYLGNFVGAVLISLLFVYSGTFSGATSHFADHVVLAKLAKDPLTILLQGIIANLVVNIAVMLAMNLKDDIAKVVAIIVTVFAFAFFGSEHVIANFASFSLVGFATGFEGMSVMSILTNFLFSTIGNIIGGGVLIGVVYAWLNKGDFKYKD
jgi:Formate/nitrite family of transporters